MKSVEILAEGLSDEKRWQGFKRIERATGGREIDRLVEDSEEFSRWKKLISETAKTLFEVEISTEEELCYFMEYLKPYGRMSSALEAVRMTEAASGRRGCSVGDGGDGNRDWWEGRGDSELEGIGGAVSCWGTTNGTVDEF